MQEWVSIVICFTTPFSQPTDEYRPLGGIYKLYPHGRNGDSWTKFFILCNNSKTATRSVCMNFLCILNTFYGNRNGVHRTDTIKPQEHYKVHTLFSFTYSI